MGVVPPREPYWRRCPREIRREWRRRGVAAGLLGGLFAALAWLPAAAEPSLRGPDTAAAAPPARIASAPVLEMAKPAPAQPSWAEQQSGLCTAAVRDAEERYHLPGGLLGTIAKVESGRPVTAMNDVRAWPWTIDADGAGYFFESKAAAVTWRSRRWRAGWRSWTSAACRWTLETHPARSLAWMMPSIPPPTPR